MKKTKTRKDKLLHKWKVPNEKTFLIKSEAMFLAIMVMVVFLFSFAVFEKQWIPTAISVVSFIVVFFLINYSFRKIYPLKEHYHLTSSGLSIRRKTGKKESKTHIKFKDIKNFKFDVRKWDTNSTKYLFAKVVRKAEADRKGNTIIEGVH